MDDPSCFSTRILSPFRGIFRGTRQWLATPNARASSTDGVIWRVHVLARLSASGWGRLEQREPVPRHVLFGAWSKTDGFHQAPVPPTCDVAALREAAQPVIDALRRPPRALPFPLADGLELWLLDRSAAPLALLASATEDAAASPPTEVNWEPTTSSDTGFCSASLLEAGTENRNSGRHRYHRDVLRDVVREAAGRPARAQWFRRGLDGQGTGLTGLGIGKELQDRVLDPDAFPSLLLREDWPTQAHCRLIQDFNAWLAPYLLTLSGLSAATREELEQAAVRQPLLVHRLHRLYPQVVDPTRLNAALVEAVLRQSAAPHS